MPLPLPLPILFFFPFLLPTHSLTHSLTPPAQTRYLHSLYLSTNGANWVYPFQNPDTNSPPNYTIPYGHIWWNFTQGENGEYLSDPCNNGWEGVTCYFNFNFNATNTTTTNTTTTNTCHIIGISLSSMNLTGYIAPNISALAQLQALQLPYNSITGVLPLELFDITTLTTLDIIFNQVEGSIPNRIANLKNMVSLSIYENHMTSAIPSEIGELTQLTTLDLSLNFFSQSLPSSLSRLTRLKSLWLDDNRFTGSLPSGIGSLSSLARLVLYANDFTGTLPDTFMQLTNAEYLLVNANQLHGTVADGFGALTNSVYFWLADNQFTGTIPNSWGNQTLSHTLLLHSNMFTGTLPATLAQLTGVYHINIENNQFTGPLPEGLYDLTGMKDFFVGRNKFTGSISNRIGNFSLMHMLDLGFNSFSQTIPSSIGMMENLKYLGLQSNYFTGTMPALRNRHIEILFVQDNRLTGEMREVLWDPINISLKHIDISSNLFSGEIPVEFFLMPNISSVAMSVNCMQGRIPDQLCTAKNLAVLSMDGLGAADGCSNNVQSIFPGSVVLFNIMQGSLPPCVWALPVLETLHFAGNGLTGSIPDISAPTLVDISMSHNYLTGHLPPSLRDRGTLRNLDLSYNRIGGILSHNNVSAPDAIVSLEVNRLSGPLTDDDFVAASYLNILDGNLFECGNLPQNDVTYDFYTCGSRAFDIALYVWVAVIFLVATVVSVFIFLKKRMSSSVPETNSSDSSSVQSDVASLTFAYDFDQRGVWKKFVTLMWHRKLYTDFISQLSLTVSNEELYRLRQFTENITSIKKYVSVLATAAVAVTLPILVVKFADSNETEEKYLTHTHTYAWFFSLAYISGNLPVYLLMCGWTCMVIVLIAVLYLIEAKYITDQLEFTEAPVSSTEASRPIDHKHRLSRASSMHAHIEAVPVLDSQGWKMAGPLLLNVCVVLLFNILYIRRLSDGTDATMLLAIQIIFAFFKVIYSTWVVPVICKPITDIKKSIWLRVRIYLFNSIWIPVAAVLRTSPACFEGLWVKRDALNSEYSFTDCIATTFDSGGTTTCTETMEYTVEVSPLTPPFLYNYQCASTLMTSYIPIFMYLYIFHLVLPLLMFGASCIQFNSYPAKYIRIKLPGIWWPYHWLTSSEKTLSFEDEEQLANDEKGVATPRKMINIKTIISQIIHHICVLFTFGLCSPQLSIAVICAIFVTSDLLQVMIGRFVHYRLASLAGGETGTTENIARAHLDYALCALSEQLSDALILVKTCFVPLLTTSTLFFCFICFDMAGDSNGWRASLWVPITFTCLFIIFIVGRRFLRKSLHNDLKKRNPSAFRNKELYRESDESLGSSPITRNTMEIET